MSVCVIIAGGDLPGEVCLPEGAYVIAADCGYRHCVRLGIRPDVLMGDFDSYEEPLPIGIPVLRHPVEKDETDTMLAVYHGESLGMTEFRIYGVFGGARPDHSLANIQMLHHMALRGLHGVLCHGGTSMEVMLPGERQFPAYRGSFSLFALTDSCTGVTVEGTKYTLSGAQLCSSFPLGVSNEITADAARITLGSGVLLVVQVRE